MISAVIPTTNRPDYLRTALKSVRRQTALAKITEIIVSENAGGRASEQVCHEFKDLPIRYVLRDPPVTGKQHFFLLFDGAANQNVAMLHDDDWWAPEHVENGLKQIAGNPDLSCYYSAYFAVGSERSRLQCHPTLEFWAGAGFPSFETVWTLALADAAVACLIDVPCSFSAIIGPRQQLVKAWREVLNSSNTYDTDRTLTLELAKLGGIVVNPVPEIFVRFHPGQDKNRSSAEQVKQFKKASLEYLVRLCREHEIDLGKEFDMRMAAAPEYEKHVVYDAILRNYEFRVLEKLITSQRLNDYQKQHQLVGRYGVAAGLLKRVLPATLKDRGKMLLRKNGH